MASSDAQKQPTVVGIGASAGGLAALRSFFDNIPADSGLSFVVVVHLSPEHKSHLADLLQPHVSFPVQQVTETILLEPDNVYIIPPNANLSAIDTHLRLSKLEEQRRERAPIDYFFRTLAAAHDGHSIAVILTGTGSDGTLGIKEVKSKGGLVFVQDPNEAEHDGMPQSAIASGMVDRILPVRDIAAAILRIDKIEPRIPPADDGEELIADPETLSLQRVVAQLRARTDRDFSRYKPATMLRRISRRMQLNYIEDPGAYIEKLRHDGEEVRALADDLLITVTSFFRDPEVFDHLSTNLIPRLLDNKGPGDSIRVWSVGCATGEEAYSLAILLYEAATRRELPPRIQVFASDLHKLSLDKARDAFYPGDVQTDVTEERLRRFFQKEEGGFRIRKEIRDLVVFAPHNLLADPPFSKIDLISCRNLLIYLQRSVQRDVIELFHYALSPEGFLLVGSAETPDAPDLFYTEDKKLCIYRKRNVPGPEPRLPVFPLIHSRSGREFGLTRSHHGEPPVYGEMHRKMLESYGPASLLVSPDNRVVHLSEQAGRFLTHPGGELTASLFKLIRDDLRIELQAALQEARGGGHTAESSPVEMELEGEAKQVTIRVLPAMPPHQDGFVLIIFYEQDSNRRDENSESPKPPVAQQSERFHELEVELNRANQRMQAVIEEYESSQEEMKAANEEMQSTNEELRSTMEELETSKEELQSINEELQTVNQENRHKVEEFAQLNADLHNLLSATDIATLFLDRELRILRFTPTVTGLFNIRATDRGRPISDLTHKLGYPELRTDAEAVLGRLIPVQREVEDDSGSSYLARLLPYRSTDDRIEGVIVTFFDISSQKRVETALQHTQERLAGDLAGMRRLYDLHARIAGEIDLNSALGEILGAACEFTHTNRGYVQLISDDGERLEMIAWRGFADDSPFIEYLRSSAIGHGRDTARVDKRRLIIEDVIQYPGLAESAAGKAALSDAVRSFQSTPLVTRKGETVGVLSTQFSQPHSPDQDELRLIDLLAWTAADFVEHHRAEEALRESEERLQMSLEAARMGTYEWNSTDQRMRLSGMSGEVLGRTPGESFLTSDEAFDLVHPNDRAGYRAVFEDASKSGKDYQTEYRIVRHDRIAWIEERGRASHDPVTGAVRLRGVHWDVTERKEAEEARQRSEDRWHRVLETDAVGVIFFDKHGTLIEANEAFLRMTGYTRADVDAGILSWRSLTPPEWLDLTEKQMQVLSATGRIGPYEKQYFLKDGSRRWMLFAGRELGDGTIAEYVIDITAQKEIETALRESDERYRLLVENVREYALFQTDTAGTVASWNPGAERLFGYTTKEMLGRPAAALLTPEDREAAVFDREIKHVLASGRAQDARWMVRKDGSRFWAQWVTEPVRDEKGQVRGVAKLLRDETERMRSEETLRQSLADKEALLKEVHHRVKNNLQVITSLLSLQAEQIDDDRILAHFNVARNRVQSIASIHELLYSSSSFSSIELGTYAKRLAGDVIRLYGAQDRIELTVVADDSSLELERAVPFGLLLNELVSNVCKHAFPGDSRGTLSVSIVSERGQLTLNIADSGIGLPEGFHDKDASTLGLYLVHRLANQLQATAAFESSQGGASVVVKMPLTVSQEMEDDA